MEAFKEFFVKSLNLYSEVDYFCDDNIRYRSIFFYPLSKIITSELTIVNKNFGIKDWELKLNFEVEGGYSFSEPPIVERHVTRTIRKDEAEIKILYDIDIKEIISRLYFSDTFTLSYRYNDTLVELKDFVVYYCEEFTKDRNPFFRVTDFKIKSSSSDYPQKIFSKNTHCIYLDLDLDYIFEEQHIYEDCPDFMKCELFFVLRNENGEKISEYCEEFEMFWSDYDTNICVDLTSDLTKKCAIGNYTVDVIFAGYQLLRCEFRIDNYDEITEDGEADV